MAGRGGGIYRGPDGDYLYGDGREVEPVIAQPTHKERAIEELLNGEADVHIRCALNLGYDAGYNAAIEAAAKEILMKHPLWDGIAAEIRALAKS